MRKKIAAYKNVASGRADELPKKIKEARPLGAGDLRLANVFQQFLEPIKFGVEGFAAP